MKRNTVILIHALYWSTIIINFSIFLFFNRDSSPRTIISNDIRTVDFLLQTSSRLIAFYIVYFYLFPNFLPQKRYFKFLIYSSFTLIIVSGIAILFFELFEQQYLNSQGLISSKPFLQHKSYLYYYFQSIFNSLIHGSLLKGFISWYSEIRVKEQLKRKNLQTELSLLRAQINPHFLFNTLNNIDILIEKEPKKASAYLNKLSDIMRFTIYDSGSEKIPLRQELEYLEKYLELQRIRTRNPNFIRYEVTGNTKGLKIAPMLFIPFIENTFKHATNKKIEHAIDISININSTGIIFNCKNAIDYAVLPQQKGGIGLELIKNRLNLMYPRHQLEIQKSDELYSINLNLDLSED